MNKFFYSQVRKMKKDKGFSLIEVLIIISTVGILSLLIANLPNSINLVGKAKHQSLAREIATKSLEDIRVMQYNNLTNGTTPISDSRINLLPSGNGVSVVENCDQIVCTNGENAKKVTITVSWKEAGKDQSLKLDTLVAEGGLNK